MVAPAAINTPSDLTAHLKAELGTFREFTQLLQTEQETLIHGDVDRLIDLARLKSDKVVLLSQLAAIRNRFLASKSINPDQSGMEKWLKQHSKEAPGATETWNALLEEAKRAQHLNQTNGVMIENRLRHNHQALAALQAIANQSAVYGPDGQTHGPGGGRPLGKV